MPIKELKAFQRTFISKGGSVEVSFSIPLSEMQKWDLIKKNWNLYKGKYSICIGKNANDNFLKYDFVIK
jgi:beta-glucosidase